MEDNEEKVKVPISWNIDGPDKTEPGQQVTFEVSAKDQYDQPFEVKPVKITSILRINDKSRGLCEEEGKVRKIGLGSYAIDVTPHILGVHELRVQNGHIRLFKNYQVLLNVTKDIPEVTLEYDFELDAEGLLTARLNEEIDINISVKENGQLADIDMKKFSIKIFGNGKQSHPPITYKGLGKYQTKFIAYSPGVYGATVIYDGTKTLKHKIQYFEHTNIRNSRLEKIPTSIVRGTPSSFEIQAIDMHGNPTGIGGDPWQVLITEGSKGDIVPLKVVDQFNGKYIVEFTLPSPGTYKFDVTLNGEHAKKSPFKIKSL